MLIQQAIFIYCLHAEGSWSGGKLYLVCTQRSRGHRVTGKAREQLANEGKAKAYALSMADKLTPPTSSSHAQ